MRAQKKTDAMLPGRCSSCRQRAFLGAAMLALVTLPLPNHTRAQTDAQSAEVRSLTIGDPIERELAGGQSHTYQLTLGEQQYFRVIVEQRGVDVIVSLTGPDGKQIHQVDSPNGTEGNEEIPYVAEAAGRYLIVVRSPDEKAPPGKYLIRIAELRPAAAGDASRSSGERAMADAQWLSGRNRAQSIKRYEDAARDFKAAGDARQEADALYSVALSYFELGDLPKAKQVAEEVLQAARRVGYRGMEARALIALGAVAGGLGDVHKGQEYEQQALPILREIKNVVEEVNVLTNLGTSYSDLAEYPQALAHYQQALALSRGVDRSAMDVGTRLALRDNEAHLLTTFCTFYSRLGQMQQALDACRQALVILREVKNERTEGIVLSRIGVTLKLLGEPQQALEYALQAVRLLGQVGARRDEAIALNDLGLIYANLGDYAQAIATYEQSLNLAREVKNPLGEGITLHNLGMTYAITGRQAQARAAFEQSLTLARDLAYRETEVAVLIALGRLHFKSGDVEQAAAFQRQALQLSRDIKLAPQEAAALYYLAETNRALGNVAEALRQGEQALNLTESLRSQIGESSLRSSFFATVQNRYEFHIATLMQAHEQRPSERYDLAALQTAERARARGLLDLLAEAQADLRQGVDASLLARQQTLQQQLNTKAAAQTRLLSRKFTEAESAALAREIANLNAQLEEVKGQIQRSSPRYAALTQPQPLGAPEIQRLLDSDTLLLEYALGEKVGYLWVVAPDSVRGYSLPPRAEIERVARNIYERLRTRPDRGAAPDSQFTSEAESLSRMLLGPAAAQLGNKRLVIVASGVLAYLPFASLPIPGPMPGGKKDSAGNSLPLLAAHEVVNLPSASVLPVIRREAESRKPAGRTIAVLADPVFEATDPRVTQAKAVAERERVNSTPPSALSRALTSFTRNGARAGLTRLAFSRQEADAIFAVAPRDAGLKATDFTASRATAMSEALSQSRIVHFATHGLLNNEQPELSGLVFSLVNEQGIAQDGFLRLHEVFNLKLSADLVVLSACETALGKEINGEGIVGLTRGFMYAGAPRVVASLWNVDDLATAELMKLFYRGMLKDGLRPAAALRAAQLELSRQRRWTSPYFWAGFVLQGEWK